MVALALTGCGLLSTTSEDATVVAPVPTDNASSTPVPKSTGPTPTQATSTVTVDPPAPDASYDSLLWARLPSLCDMPPVQLTNGEAPIMVTPSGEKRAGFLNPRPDSGQPPKYLLHDLAGLGHLQAIGFYNCGVPQSDAVWHHVIVVDHDGTTIGSLAAEDLVPSGLVWPESLKLQGDQVVLHWTGVEQLGGPVFEGSGILSWRNGQLVVDPA